VAAFSARVVREMPVHIFDKKLHHVNDLASRPNMIFHLSAVPLKTVELKAGFQKHNFEGNLDKLAYTSVLGSRISNILDFGQCVRIHNNMEKSFSKIV
jgi:hypothetical protein